jgi:hypothetical protein
MYKNNKCYQSIENQNSQVNNNQHIWYTHFKGYIIKNWVDKDTNRIIQERIPYNQPNNYLKYLDNYFMYKLK